MEVGSSIMELLRLVVSSRLVVGSRLVVSSRLEVGSRLVVNRLGNRKVTLMTNGISILKMFLIKA